MLRDPANTSSRIALQPDSLYIATQTIPLPDKSGADVSFERNAWHWSFFFSDAAGKLTQLHWNVANVEENIAEYFVRTPRAQVHTRTGDSVYVSFIRLSGWRSPGIETLAVTLDALYKEHEGKPIALLRAMSPMRSCRTWILDAVATFVANGWMTETPVNLEAVVKRESKGATDRYIGMLEEWNLDLNQFKPTIKDI